MEIMVFIPCVVVGEFVSANNRFNNEEDKEAFEDIFSLYSTNPTIIKEFAINFSNQYLFPPKYKRNVLKNRDLFLVL